MSGIATNTGIKPTGDKPAEAIPGYSWYALGLLTIVNVLNFVDRTLIYLLFTPIKADMYLSDTQLALLGATSFVILFTLLGVPFGRMADRVSRKKLIAAGLAVWSLFSGLTGFAHDFWGIFLCRVMVGVGEATLGPAAFSLISDYFPPRVRATVQAVYSSGIALGAGVAFLVGGPLAKTLGWRPAFFLLSFPGLFFAVLVLLLKEKPRGQTESAAPRYGRDDWRVLFTSAPLIYLYLGYALVALSANSISIWVTTFFVRLHNFDLVFMGLWGGLISIVAGVPGTVTGGYLADRLRRRGRGGRMLFGACAALLAVPFWLGLIFSDKLWMLLAANVFLIALSLIWLGPATAEVHEITGPKLRGLGIAVFIFAVNVASYVVGAPLIGMLNDQLGATENPANMRYSLLVSPLACLVGALLLWRGAEKLKKERAAPA
ncbi:MAG TPA: MFS transporter [Pyrinomonadaceae bacterium]|nr:MFS transporter [Pyrinomonadaceae bacterium]